MHHRQPEKEEKIMNIAELFKDAKEKKTYNKFYALGRVQGIGTDDFGRKHFILFVRSDQEVLRANRLREDLTAIRDENAQLKNTIMMQGACVQALRERLEKHEDVSLDEKYVCGDQSITISEIIKATQDAAAALENKNERKRSEPAQETYLSIEYGAAALPSDTRINDMVEVVGHISGYFYRKETWRKEGYILQLVADEIRQAEPVATTLFGENGFATERPSTFVVLKGNVLARKTLNGWTRLLLSVDRDTKNRRPSTIWAQYTRKMRVNDIKPEEGMTVGLYGTFSTTRKEDKSMEYSDSSPAENTRPRYKRYVNIIVEDMCIVGSPEKDNKVPAGFGNFGIQNEDSEKPVKKRE